MSTECPHCRNDLHPQATVCGNCGATLLRGARFAEMKLFGALFGVLGIIFGLASGGGAEGFVMGGVGGLFLGFVGTGLLMSNRKRWMRNYHS